MKEILKNYLEIGGAVLMSSHVLDTVQNLCNKFIIMNKGEIVRESSVDEINGSLEEEFFELVNSLNLNEEEEVLEDDDETQD